MVLKIVNSIKEVFEYNILTYFQRSLTRKTKENLFLTIPVLFCSVLNFSCQERANNTPPIYKNIEPKYNLIQLQSTSDTLHFPLNENTYNAIKSFNIFFQKGKELIAFYDERSQSVNVYNFDSILLVKKLPLKKWFKGQRLYKTTAYIKNFDSIFVTNNTTLYLFDTAGTVKNVIHFLKKPPFTWAVFENTTPPVFKDKQLYMAVRPYVKETSLKDLQEWRVIYAFNMHSNKATLHYHLPEFLQKDFYGRRFFDYSYCYNNHGNFVFSFPADSTIYETNLTDYHIAYYGKSQFQKNIIRPVSKEDLLKDEGFKNYLIRDSYGSIYFDPYTKRYLREAKSKITEEDYMHKNWKKNQHVIIFDEQFKIIGESLISNEILLSTIFIKRGGSIYARTKVSDEYTLHFVRLIYREKAEEPAKLAQKKTTANK